MKVINSKSDFKWYVTGLDVDSKRNHRHVGEPDKYPCRVISELYDDPNGPYYTYYHSFIYKQSVKCGHCGHEELIWPDQAE